MKTDAGRLKPRLVGTVLSDKQTQTIIVQITTSRRHPLGKYVKHWTKLHAHDVEEVAQIGDTVEIEECRPISKKKSWRLVAVLRSTVLDAGEGK